MEKTWDVSEEEAIKIEKLLSQNRKEKLWEIKKSDIVLSLNDVTSCIDEKWPFGASDTVLINANDTHNYLIINRQQLINMWSSKIDKDGQATDV